MTTFPTSNYWNNAARTEAEQKVWGEDFLASTKQLVGGAPVSTLTLVSDQITPTTGIHLVETQGSTSTDNLAAIVQTNMPDGSLLILSAASAGHTVVCKHAAGGTGQLVLNGAVDFSLTDTSMALMLQRVGTTWVERQRSYGSNATAYRGFYGVASLGQNTFTGRQEWTKGANLASAGTLTLGTDGNYFNVTGTTTIAAISTAPVGTRVVLRFASTGGLLVHGASTLILQDGSNYLWRADDVLEFIAEGAGVWRQISSGGGPRILHSSSPQINVQNTTTLTQVTGIGVPANTLIGTRRLRLTLTGYWNFGLVQNFGAFTIYGTEFQVYLGATLCARAYVPGGIWSGGSPASGAVGYIYGTDVAAGMTIEITFSAYSSVNQWTHIAIHTPRATSFTPTVAGLNSAVSALTTYGVVLGAQAVDVNGVLAPGRGNTSVDATIAQTVGVYVMHNFAATQNYFVLEHQVLELLV